MAVSHPYPTLKIYKGGHETPRGGILLREHGGNMEGTLIICHVSRFSSFLEKNALTFFPCGHPKSKNNMKGLLLA